MKKIYLKFNDELYGRVVCAALLHNDCIYMGRKGHCEIFPMEPIGVLRNAEQGFVTENGYFVDRELGLSIALYFDQINIKHNPKDMLFSEDLKKDNLRVRKFINGYTYREHDSILFDKDSITYDGLKEFLLSDKVYDVIKSNEDNVFELIPELKMCFGFNQNNKWHVYDVYEHILHVISGVDSNLCLRIAALFHDIGKPYSYTEDNDGVGHFYNHWNKSLEIFLKYKDKFNLTDSEIDLISSLIFYHDINIDKMNKDEKDKMIELIGEDNLGLLFSLKRADLLAQSSLFHYLLSNLEQQERSFVLSK